MKALIIIAALIGLALLKGYLEYEQAKKVAKFRRDNRNG